MVSIQMMIIMLYYIVVCIYGNSIKEYKLAYLLRENELQGKLIGNIIMDLQSMGYQLTSENLQMKSLPNVWVELDVSRHNLGTLRVARTIDLEAICKSIMMQCKDGKAILVLLVNLWMKSAQLVGVVRVEISVLDVEDNIPEFTQPELLLNLRESGLKSGRRIYLLAAQDADIAIENKRIYYGLQNYDKSIFRLEADAEPQLILMLDLDAEKPPANHYMILTAGNTIGGPSSRLNVTIRVLDDNDNPPHFALPRYSIVVREDIPPGTRVFQLEAKDLDSSSRIIYRSTGACGETVTCPFQVLSNGSVIVTAPGLDYESYRGSGRYLLNVWADDGLFQARTALEIVLENVNDERPRIETNPAKIKIEENSAVGLLIGQIQVVDPDTTTLQCQHTTPRGLSLLARQATSASPGAGSVLAYDVRTEIVFDRESNSVLTVLLSCVEEGELTSSLTVTVTITDVNDNAPRFSKQTYSCHVSESAAVDTRITQVMATDPDEGINQIVHYSLRYSPASQSASSAPPFKIDSQTGEITVASQLDRELCDQYQLEVSASNIKAITPRNDGSLGKQLLSSKSVLLIYIDDINDHAPQLLPGKPPPFHVLEGGAPRLIGQLRWIDSDQPNHRNSHVTAHLIWSEQDVFSLAENGSVYVTRPLDREIKDKYCARVRLQDHGLVPRSLATQVNVCVIVDDENDNAPIIIEPRSTFIATHSNTTSSIQSDDSVMTTTSILSVRESPPFVVLQVVAMDADINDNARISYHVDLPDILSTYFSCNITTGFLTLITRLSLTTLGRYTLKLLARDHGNPSLADSKKITLHIQDIPARQFSPSLLNTPSLTSDPSSLLIVLILSTISAALIVSFASAVACMLRPSLNCCLCSTSTQLCFKLPHQDSSQPRTTTLASSRLYRSDSTASRLGGLPKPASIYSSNPIGLTSSVLNSDQLASSALLMTVQSQNQSNDLFSYYGHFQDPMISMVGGCSTERPDNRSKSDQQWSDSGRGGSDDDIMHTTTSRNGTTPGSSHHINPSTGMCYQVAPQIRWDIIGSANHSYEATQPSSYQPQQQQQVDFI